MNRDLTTYYNERANEYDKVYALPKEQNDLRTATKIIQDIFADKAVLEVASGTGYWTKILAHVATRLLATDINDSVLKIAKSKVDGEHVSFKVADMYSLTTDIKYESLFGGFIWSHILIQDIDRFLMHIQKLLSAEAIIVFIDSKAVNGTVHDKNTISKTDQYGNTFQNRSLENGSTHIVLKNFPSKGFLEDRLYQICSDVKYIELEFYWMVIGRLKQ